MQFAGYAQFRLGDYIDDLTTTFFIVFLLTGKPIYILTFLLIFIPPRSVGIEHGTFLEFITITSLEICLYFRLP